MADVIEMRRVRTKASGDTFSDAIDAQRDSFGQNQQQGSPLDGDEAMKEYRRVLAWYYMERDRQAANRHEMALDCDFYDNIQWDPNDAAELRDRGQMPLVYNEIAPMVDWIIGTERRARVDWAVLPRCEDDVDIADVKTKVMKYVSDINRVPFTRSRAFADAVKAGVGWVDDGARDDPTQDALYSKYEDWRNVLHDSQGYDLDLMDARFVFRWRWVDEDIAVTMFPERRAQIECAVADIGNMERWDDDEATGFYDPNHDTLRTGRLAAAGSYAMQDVRRNRVKLIECQYRKPVKTKIVTSGPLRGQYVSDHDVTLLDAVQRNGHGITERVMLRTHFAVFTERDLIAWGPSVYRHNRFTLTPIWCYRRSKDRMPYGVIRRVRDIQQDLNKRASKALFLLNTNQIIMEEGAVADVEEARDEADRPDGVIVKKANKTFEIRRDSEQSAGQVNLLTLQQQTIQRGSGISNENLGRQTNAVSGEAIHARQLQGSVVTTEPFDNLRFAVQVQGEKQLSLQEQFYTEEKVIRLTGAKGPVEWVRINQAERQPDGSTRYINDITASAADFVVSEQDYNGTLREVMFNALKDVAAKFPPEIALRIMRMAMEFSDLPNKDEIADQIRAITGEQDPNKKLTPEEIQQQQQQMQLQQEALDLQRQTAQATLQEALAKAKKLNAEAEKAMAEADRARAEAASAGQESGLPPEVEQGLRDIQKQASDTIQKLSDQLREAQSKRSTEVLRIGADKDTAVEVAHINAAAERDKAEIQARSDKRFDQLAKMLDGLTTQVRDANKVAAEAVKRAEKAEAKASEPPPPAPAPAPTPAPAAAPQPIELTLNVDARSGPVTKKIDIKTDGEGNVTGGTVTETPAGSDK